MMDHCRRASHDRGLYWAIVMSPEQLSGFILLPCSMFSKSTLANYTRRLFVIFLFMEVGSCAKSHNLSKRERSALTFSILVIANFIKLEYDNTLSRSRTRIVSLIRMVLAQY